MKSKETLLATAWNPIKERGVGGSPYLLYSAALTPKAFFEYLLGQPYTKINMAAVDSSEKKFDCFITCLGAGYVGGNSNLLDKF